MAKNSYNPYNDVLEVYNQKKKYDTAKAKNDKAGMQAAAKAADDVRARLSINDYGDLANQLKNTNTEGAKKLVDEYSTFGMSSFNDFLNGSKLATVYGYPPKQISDLVKVNDNTGEVMFGGVNIGKPNAMVGGVPYFDNEFSASAVDDYIKRTGITNSKDYINETLGIQMKDRKGNDEKREELWSEATANPFKTDVGKAIMKEYNLKALQGRDNEAASGAASNSGNIDSFAVANALKQQASLTAMGQQKAIEAQARRIENLRLSLGDIVGTQQIENQGALSTIGKLSDLEQRDFENEQSEKLTDHQINLDMAKALGYEPKAWAIGNNQYFGDDGMLLNPATDFGTIIKSAEEKLKTATDPEEIKRLNATINDATFARQFKVNNYPEYGKYAGEVSGYSPRRTLEGEAIDFEKGQTAKNDAFNRVVSYASAGLKPDAKDIEAAGLGNMTPEQVLSAYKNNTLEQLSMQAKYSTKSGSGGDVVVNGLTPEDMALSRDIIAEFDKIDSDSKSKSKVGQGPKDYVWNVLPMIEVGDTRADQMKAVKQSIIDNSYGYNIDVSEAKIIWQALFGSEGISWLNDYADVPEYYGGSLYADGTNPAYRGMIKKSELESWEKENGYR